MDKTTALERTLLYMLKDDVDYGEGSAIRQVIRLGVQAFLKDEVDRQCLLQSTSDEDTWHEVKAEIANVGDLIQYQHEHGGIITFVVDTLDHEYVYERTYSKLEPDKVKHGNYKILLRNVMNPGRIAKVGDVIKIIGSRACQSDAFASIYDGKLRRVTESDGVGVLTSDLDGEDTGLHSPHWMYDIVERSFENNKSQSEVIGHNIYVNGKFSKFVSSKDRDSKKEEPDKERATLTWQQAIVSLKSSSTVSEAYSVEIGALESILKHAEYPTTAELIEMLKMRKQVDYFPIAQNEVFTVQYGSKSGKDMFNYYVEEPSGPADILVVRG